MDLQWRQVDFKRKLIIFENTKSKRNRSVPMTEEANRVLGLMARRVEPYKIDNYDNEISDPEGWVFLNEKTGKPVKTIFFAWKKYRERAGLPQLRIHDLRHLAATNFITKGGADIGTVAHILGHSNVNQSGRYVHLTGDYTSDIVNKAASKVFGGYKNIKTSNNANQNTYKVINNSDKSRNPFKY